MTSLAKILSGIVGQAFEAEGLPAELGAVRVSDRPDLAQFQCNGAMAAAKVAKKNPREVAGAVLARLEGHEALEFVEIAGPGFINLNLTNGFISTYLADNSQNNLVGFQPFGVDREVILDYGGPNVAKAMHVGHLRSSIIGDALRRMYVRAGFKAYGDVHMGDWGLPMGQVISELKLMHPDWVYFDDDFDGEYPKDSPVTMDDLAEIYPKASGACKADEDRLALARAATAKLQNGHVGYRALWQHFVRVSIAGMKANFDALGVHFDWWEGEGSVHDLIALMVEQLREKGLAEESDGAIVVHVARDDDAKEVPPLILYKSDGAVMYGTTDLATIKSRVNGMNPRGIKNPEKIIYVVDQRQGLHFEQVFRAARIGDIAPDSVELIHAGFGTMNGTDGKPFKTRAGGVMKLDDLIAMAIDKAQARLDEANLDDDINAAERTEIARMVGIAAIKFADLQNNRISDYVFDLDRMTAFEGKTGPYMLYQVVRIQSLLRKAAAQDLAIADAVQVGDDDQGLCLLLAEFSDHFAVALDNHTPHVLCDYAYKLAQEFSSFYARCHILSEDDEAGRASRLALCALVAKQLNGTLGLLGIAVPDRM